MFETTYLGTTKLPSTTADEKRLAAYRMDVARVVRERDTTRPEYALAHPTLPLVTSLRAQLGTFASVRHVIVVGIGGSSLGLEALHATLATDEHPKLTVLDMITPAALTAVSTALRGVKKVSQVAVCIISKSGTTTETLANASVLLRLLEAQYGRDIHARVIYIGNPGTPLAKVAKKQGSHYLPMPAVVGGRFSVTTEVALVPLILLGHAVETIVAGMVKANDPVAEEAVAIRAAQLHAFVRAGYRHFNFFAFEARLYKLGCWYRQLFAESLGKATTRDGKPVKGGMVPTISTPVELHSVGQLYLAAFPGVLTEFVTVDDNGADYKIGPTSIAPHLKKFTLEEVSTALYGGVVSAYQAQGLPYRATVLSEDVPAALGYYLGAAMREVMYIAHLMNVDAFDQPNVELYKDKTRALLGL
jgi:glucose-6-phosphate isomerase